MGYYLSFPFVVFAVVVQVTLLPSFRFVNAQPNLVLLMVLVWAVHAEWEEAVWRAFFGGILADLMSVLPTGTSVIALVLGVFAIRFIDENFFDFNVLLLLIAVPIITLTHQIIVLIVLATSFATYDLLNVIQTVILPTIALNTILIIPIYIILRLFQRRIPEPQSAW